MLHNTLSESHFGLGLILDFYMLQDETRTSLNEFDTKASILYLVSMSTFWILTVATGVFDVHPL